MVRLQSRDSPSRLLVGSSSQVMVRLQSRFDYNGFSANTLAGRLIITVMVRLQSRDSITTGSRQIRLLVGSSSQVMVRFRHAVISSDADPIDVDT
jgi:hypothetical protein